MKRLVWGLAASIGCGGEMDGTDAEGRPLGTSVQGIEATLVPNGAVANPTLATQSVLVEDALRRRRQALRYDVNTMPCEHGAGEVPGAPGSQ